MKLKLIVEKDITPASIKKINKILVKETLVFITAKFCGFCVTFAPEKDKFIKTSNINIVEIDSEALNILKVYNNDIYKLLIPPDGKIFFPMIMHISKKKWSFL